LRGSAAADTSSAFAERQALPGFDPQYTDIVDYIVRITDEIWRDLGIGRIYETYDHACTVYSPYGVVRSVEEVIASTGAALAASRDGWVKHLNVAWSELDGTFHTSHLGLAGSVNSGWSQWGAPTGRSLSSHFIAHCVSRENRIYDEWLVRDNGAVIRQLDLDLLDTARRLAATPSLETWVLSPPTRLVGQIPRAALEAADTDPETWARILFDDIWNRRRLDRVVLAYATDVICHAAGGRRLIGVRNIQGMILQVLAAVPDGVMHVEHVCWSEEGDGVILAVRWRLEGTSKPGGVLENCPAGLPTVIAGISHLRFAHGRIIEEWMMFDELGALVAALRA
jgi:predicted ester cyclase